MLFKKKKGSDRTKTPAPQKRCAPSILSADLRIVGDLVSDGEIQVDGSVDGDIRSKSLLLGKTANVKGEIVADSVRVHGAVNGQIKARSVILAKNARVVGNVQHGTLSIETGAYMEGHCTRMEDAKDAGDNPIKLVVGDQATAAAGNGTSAAPEKKPDQSPSSKTDDTKRAGGAIR